MDLTWHADILILRSISYLALESSECCGQWLTHQSLKVAPASNSHRLSTVAWSSCKLLLDSAISN